MQMVNLYRDPDGENVLKPSTNNNNLSNIAQTVAGDNNLTDNKELRLRIATLEATITKMKVASCACYWTANDLLHYLFIGRKERWWH